jgi:hypothetical protein
MKKLRQIIYLFLTLAIMSSNLLAGDYSQLNFIGFSRDGKYLAFEEYGVKFPDEEGYSSIFFVDTMKNAYAAPAENIALGANLRREVFLIFKESVNNIVKYSACTMAEIELKIENSEIYLKLHDNGKGFETEAATDGHGLVSMKQRALGLHGKLEIRSGKISGTTTILVVPLGANPVG